MEKLELLVVDGGSIDNTVNLVEVLQEKYSNIRLIPVEGANTAVGRNIAVRNANGDMIFNFSSHAYVETNTIKILALKLQNSEKQVVGVGCKDKLPLDQSSLVARGG